MEKLEKLEILNELFLTYQTLFTDKQIEYFNFYYELDYSYQEIADKFKVSRNAIFDSIKKVEENLFVYEEKLKIVTNRKKRIELLNKYNETKDENYLNELKRMDE